MSSVHISVGVCLITVNMEAGVNRHGTVLVVTAMEQDTVEQPATHVSNVKLHLCLSVFLSFSMILCAMWVHLTFLFSFHLRLSD